MAAAAAAAAAALGGALAAVGGAVVAAAGAVQLAAFTWDGSHIAECPELASCRPLQACSMGKTVGDDHHYVTIIGRCGGAVRCAGDNSGGQLGTGDRVRRDTLGPTDPPLAAISVGCGYEFAIALHSDGAMSSWGTNYQCALGRGGDNSPAAISGVPPVAVLGVGWNFVIAVTHGDHAYGWGCQNFGQLTLGFGPARPSPQRIPALCGRGLRRIACARASVVAEAAAGLLWWGWGMVQQQPLPADLNCAAGTRFPLRGLAHFGYAVVAADGAGAVWGGSIRDGRQAPLRRISLAGECAVAAAGANSLAVVLSEEGRLYEVSPSYDWHPDFCREIRSGHPQLPLGLVPHGGASSQHIVLVPDHCGGKARLRLFARIAACLGLPDDPLRATLTQYVVNKVYMNGASGDPFGVWL